MSTHCEPSSPPFFFFNDPATTAIYTLSLHDALPIFWPTASSATIATLSPMSRRFWLLRKRELCAVVAMTTSARSEEHTSELQSPVHLVCRLLLEKKKIKRVRDAQFYCQVERGP